MGRTRLLPMEAPMAPMRKGPFVLIVVLRGSRRPKTLLFHSRENAERVQSFFEKLGGHAIVIHDGA
jgi:hypothetical protein